MTTNSAKTLIEMDWLAQVANDDCIHSAANAVYWGH